MKNEKPVESKVKDQPNEKSEKLKDEEQNLVDKMDLKSESEALNMKPKDEFDKVKQER